jgi:hypothetical protein
MEFEEMQKIWSAQNDEPLYAINEEALHRRIIVKRNQARHITNVSEWLGILANLGAGCFVLEVNISSHNPNYFMYAMATWMVCTGLYFVVARRRRIRGARMFDRSMAGDLDHAISVAAYQVRHSQLMRWNILPIALFILFGIWEDGKSGWAALGLMLFFVLAYFASRWEHRIYEKRKHELELLQKKLQEN